MIPFGYPTFDNVYLPCPACSKPLPSLRFYGTVHYQTGCTVPSRGAAILRFLIRSDSEKDDQKTFPIFRSSIQSQLEALNL